MIDLVKEQLKRARYIPEISLGTIISAVAAIVAIISAYFLFVSETKAALAEQTAHIQQNKSTSEDNRAELRKLPTAEQFRQLEESVREIRDNVNWLVRQKKHE